MGCNTSQDVHQPVPVAAHQHKEESRGVSKPLSPTSKSSSADEDCDVVDGGGAHTWSTDMPDDSNNDNAENVKRVSDGQERVLDNDNVPRTSDSQPLNTMVASGLGSHGASFSSHHSTLTFPLHQHRRSSLEIGEVVAPAVTQVEVRCPFNSANGQEHAIGHETGIRRSSLLAGTAQNSAAGGRHRARSFAKHSVSRLSIPTSTLPPPRHRSRSLSLSAGGHAVDDVHSARPIESWGRSALVVDPIGSTTARITDSMALSGYFCEVAQNCEEAIDMARTRSYFMVLLDSSLPEDDALHVSRLIRSFENSEQIDKKSSCFIFRISAENQSNEYLSDLTSSGMDGVITASPSLCKGIHEALAMKAAQLNAFVVVDKHSAIKPATCDTGDKTSTDDVCLQFTDEDWRESGNALPMAFERKDNVNESKLKHQVLLVQESKNTPADLYRTLTSCGFALHMANNSKDATAKIDRQGYDVVLVTIEEGKLSEAADCCANIRSAEALVDSKRLPFVVFGIHNTRTETSHEMLANAGMNGCLALTDGDYGIHEALALFRVNPMKYISTSLDGNLELNTIGDTESKNTISWRLSAP